MEAVPLKVFPQDASSPIVGAILHRCHRRRPPPPPPPPLPPPPPPLRPTHTPKTLTHIHSHPDSLTFILTGTQTHSHSDSLKLACKHTQPIHTHKRAYSSLLFGDVSGGLLVVRPQTSLLSEQFARMSRTHSDSLALRRIYTQSHSHSGSLTQTTHTQARLTLDLRGCLELGACFSAPRGAPPGKIARARRRPDCGDVLGDLRVWLSRLPFFQGRL